MGVQAMKKVMIALMVVAAAWCCWTWTAMPADGTTGNGVALSTAGSLQANGDISLSGLLLARGDEEAGAANGEGEEKAEEEEAPPAPSGWDRLWDAPKLG
jgi:hypothetical protein